MRLIPNEIHTQEVVVIDRFEILNSDSPRPEAERILFCDGTGGSLFRADTDLELSHWRPNRTPAEYRAGTSTEICFMLLAARHNMGVLAPSQFNSAIPDDIEQIILKCVSNSPADRFPDADEVRNALDQSSVANKWRPKEAADWWQANQARPFPNEMGIAQQNGSDWNAVSVIGMTEEM